MKRYASISTCGRYRWLLRREWDARPLLLVVMFNPSTADDRIDDPTIKTLMRRASRWGYGGIVVVNLIPLRGSSPAPAIEMVCTWDTRQAWDERDALHVNVGVITAEVRRAGAVLLAYGALGGQTQGWTDHVLEEIESAAWREDGGAVPMFVMGRTKDGFPIHPQARGKHRVPTDAPLLPWADAA